MIHRKKGLTLVEVMFTALILLFVLIASVAVFTISMRSITMAREVSLATDDLKDVLEKIRSVAFSDIITVFPDGEVLDLDIVGGAALTDEVVVVTYPHGTTADPLWIDATITWTNRHSGTRTYTFSTIRTRML